MSAVYAMRTLTELFWAIFISSIPIYVPFSLLHQLNSLVGTTFESAERFEDQVRAMSSSFCLTNLDRRYGGNTVSLRTSVSAVFGSSSRGTRK